MDLMTMTMPAQTGATGHGQTAHGPTALVSAPTNKGAFGRILHQMTGTGEGPGELAGPIGTVASIVPSGQLSQPLLEALLAQTGDEATLADTIGQLLYALQDDAEWAAQLPEHAEFAAWFAETAALLQTGDTGAMAGTEIRQEAATNMDLRVLLAQLFLRLTSGEADEAMTNQADKLRTVLHNLAETEPALAQLIRPDGAKPQPGPAETAAKPGEQAVQTAGKPAAAEPVRSNAVTEPPAYIVAKTADASDQQLLARLAHRNLPVHVLTGTTTGQETGTVNPGTAADASALTALNAGTADEGMQPNAMSLANPPVTHNPATPSVTPSTERPAMMHAGQFAEQMGEWMVKQFSVLRAGELSQARITLVPEHLGHLDVKISVQNGTVTAVFAAETTGAREMLELQLPQLRMALQQQGFQVERLVVSQQAAGLGSGQFQDERQRQPWEREEQKQNSREAMSEDELFDLLSGVDESYGGESLLRYGSTFHATA